MKIHPMDRKQIVQSHLLLQFGTLLCGGFGFIVILSNKIYYDKMHFRTWHSLMGLFTIITICIEVLLGLFLRYRWLRNILNPVLPQTIISQNGSVPSQAPSAMTLQPSNSSTLQPSNRAKVSTTVTYIHRIFGLVVFYAGIATIILGFRSDYFISRVPLIAQLILISFIITIAVCIMLAMRGTKSIKTKPSLPIGTSSSNPNKIRGSNQIIGSLNGSTDMLSFLPTTVAPIKDVNTAKDK